MKMKTMAAALIMALGAGGVQAVTINLGPLGTTPDFGIRTVTGSFTDIFNFDVVDPYNWVGGNFGNLPVRGFSINTYSFNITNFEIELFNAPNAGGSSLGSLIGASNYETTGLMPAGDYSFVVSGNTTGSLGGKYSYAAVAQPIPEPETYALFLASLGLLGFFARRRSNPLG